MLGDLLAKENIWEFFVQYSHYMQDLRRPLQLLRSTWNNVWSEIEMLIESCILAAKKVIRKRRNNIFLLRSFLNFCRKVKEAVVQVSRFHSQIRCGTENGEQKTSWEIMKFHVQGHLQPPLTETSTSLATVTTDTRASKTMLKKSYFSDKNTVLFQ